MQQVGAPANIAGNAELLASMQASGMLVTHKRYTRSFAQGWHEHERASIDFVLEGGGVGTYGGREVRSGPGRVEFFRDGVRHNFRADAAGIRTMHVVIPPAMLGDRGPWRDVVIEELDHTRALGLSARILGELCDPDASSILAVESLACELLDEVAQVAAKPCRRAGWLGPVRDLLRSAADRPIELDELAQAAGVHRGHLAREFRAKMGMSAGEYHRRIRLARAGRQLTDTRDSIARIAQTNGFCDQAHLTRVMKSAYGFTPGVLRRALRH